MPNTSRPLLRFVQLRRAGDPAADMPVTCTTGPAVVVPCFDFTDDWSAEVKEAVTANNRTQGRALYRQRVNALDGPAALAARLGLALLKQATIDERLTVGKLRELMDAWSDRTGMSSAQAQRAIGVATTWAVDMLTLGRWLFPMRSPGTSEPARLLRGLVLVRLARSKAEEVCLVRRLVFGHEIQLPPLPATERSPDELQEKADRLATQSLDLVRMQNRWHAIARKADPTLAELRDAGYKDLEKSLEAIDRTAIALGLPKTTTLGAMKRVLDDEHAEARRSLERRASVQAGSSPLDLDQWQDPRSTSGVEWTPIPPRVPVLSAQTRVLGRGDLMIIRTAHLRYELGEISHIENVLASEVRERSHVIDTSTSETITESSQELSETTQELETTEQNSLERAMETTASRTNSMSLGVSISGGLGPVKAGIDINAASSTSTSTSMSSAVSYSKSLTEAASELLRSEEAYRRTIRTRTRVTETNLHKFDNADGAANIAGIYRWVDKVDEARLYNYGERLMLEFIVPEPATQFVYAMLPDEDENAPEPPAGWFLDIEELNQGNYVNKAARWDVVGLEPPPPEEVFAAATFVDPAAKPFDYKKDSTDESQPQWGYSSYIGEVPVPEGYAASVAYVTVTWSLQKGEYQTEEGTPPQAVQIAIGADRIIVNDEGDGEATVAIDHEIGGALPIGISADQRGGLTVVIRVRCVRTDDAYEAWRLRTYESLRAGYLAQLAAYETDLRLMQTRQAYASSTPPEANRLIEMQELKRGCQTILTGQDFDLFGALSFPADDIPRINRAEIAVEADYIQFFEDLFEWENLVYLFYPYQWAGRERWLELQDRTSTDPIHQAFLQAGAARVVVPVRPGYEHAVGTYLATSEIPALTPQEWRDGENPYPPIEELIADALDRPEDEVAVDEPWEVVSPTSLIFLQVGADLNAEA